MQFRIILIPKYAFSRLTSANFKLFLRAVLQNISQAARAVAPDLAVSRQFDPLKRVLNEIVHPLKIRLIMFKHTLLSGTRILALVNRRACLLGSCSVTRLHSCTSNHGEWVLKLHTTVRRFYVRWNVISLRCIA